MWRQASSGWLGVLFVLALPVPACGARSTPGAGDNRLSRDSDGGAQDQAPELVRSCCGVLVTAQLALPAGASSEVADVSTDGGCSASNDNGLILVASTGLATECLVTVRLASGTVLTSTVQFRPYEAACCGIGSAIDASSLSAGADASYD
jgi:hypothetical protein